MKAYTVYQPYAYATVAGLKHYETRPRRTNIRGRVAVHAAKKDAWRSGILEKGIMPEIEAALSEHQGVGNRFAHLDYGARKALGRLFAGAVRMGASKPGHVRQAYSGPRATGLVGMERK